MKAFRERKFCDSNKLIYKKDKLLYNVTRRIINIKYFFSKNHLSVFEKFNFDKTMFWMEKHFLNKSFEEQNGIFDRIKTQIFELDCRYIVLVDFINDFLINKKKNC
ncbi:hypothetical protein P3W45_001127 [Vairimorpha bombi]|jgi:hypothetical protein